MSEGNEVKIVRLQEQMKNIDTKVEEGFKALKIDNERVELSVKNDILRLEKTLTDFMSKSETKYAGIWVEKAVSWAGYLVIGTVITALMYLVIKK